MPSPTCCARWVRFPGIERVRFTSPHPRDFTSEVIAAMAETPTVMPSLHMPLQSGSDQVLRAMRRSYRRDRFLAILDEVRASIPDAAITTDIIVGFPGETEADFADTLEVVERARFSAAFTFQYSPRPGTPAAEMDDQIPKAVVQERYERLVEALERISWEENLAPGRYDRRGPRGRGRGAQGRADPAHVGPGARRPTRALLRGRVRAARRLRDGGPRRRRATPPDRHGHQHPRHARR